jgi:LysW-gamma-L-lysine carboxypeptidase
MQALGFTNAYVDETGNAVGVMGDGPQQIILLGHIDTVSGEIDVRVEGDVLYGRGTVDAKGPLSSFVDAVARVGAVEGWQMVVIGVIDEERDSVGARGVVERYRPEMLVIGEPSGWNRITLGYKGSAVARLQVAQPVSHTAGKDDSAGDVMFAVWQDVLAWVKTWNDDHPRLFDQILPSIQAMQSSSDGFLAQVVWRVGARLPVDYPPDRWYTQLAHFATAHNAVMEPIGFAIPAYRAEKNTPLVRQFLRAIRAKSAKPSFLVKTGTADLNIVAPVWNCPAVVYGPGDSSLDHTPNEHIHLSEYAKAVDILEMVLRNLTNT